MQAFSVELAFLFTRDEHTANRLTKILLTAAVFVCPIFFSTTTGSDPASNIGQKRSPCAENSGKERRSLKHSVKAVIYRVY